MINKDDYRDNVNNRESNSVDGGNGPILRIINVGDSVTKNLTIYEYGDDIIAVDFGIELPEDDSVGIDYIVPDMTYLLENSHKFRALIISHAHADHFAAVPHLLQQINVPIYANKMAQGYIREKLKEKEFKGLAENVKFHDLSVDTKDEMIGKFKLSAFGVNHSVPGSLGLVIDTPEGLLLHMADFKIDQTPVLDPPIDLQSIEEYGKKGVLCLASDCMGVRKDGFIPSEKTLNDTFPKIYSRFQNNQLFITTISSNISRMYQIIDAAIKAGRRVVPTGRSIDSSIRIARNAGYLPFPDDVFVDLDNAHKHSQDTLVYIIAGCFGQVGSALDRLSKNSNKHIALEKNAIVIFSAEPNPPGVLVDVERVKSDLILLGVEIFDHLNMENLHVSGHGHRGDLSKIVELVNPKYFIPIGGNPMHIHAYANMVYAKGYPKGSVFEVQEGDVIEFKNGTAKFGKRIEITDLLIDGTSLSPVVVQDRTVLSEEGLFVVIVPIDKSGNFLANKVDIVTRGFIYVKGSQQLMNESKKFAEKTINKYSKKKKDWNGIRKRVESEIERFLYKKTGRNPFVIVHSMDV